MTSALWARQLATGKVACSNRQAGVDQCTAAEAISLGSPDAYRTLTMTRTDELPQPFWQGYLPWGGSWSYRQELFEGYPLSRQCRRLLFKTCTLYTKENAFLQPMICHMAGHATYKINNGQSESLGHDIPQPVCCFFQTCASTFTHRVTSWPLVPGQLAIC